MESASDVRQWVLEQTARLTPPDNWPDSAAALARFHARLEAEPRRAAWRWPAMVAAGMAVVAAMLLWPAGRVAAYQAWQFLTVHRVAFIRVKEWPKGVPSPKVGLVGVPVPIPARDVDEARWRVHYDPRLPRPGVLSGSPQLYTTFRLSAATVVKTADLDLALQQAGVTGLSVPAQWDGAEVALHTSDVVIAQWPEIVLAQSLPLTLTAPPGFDFAAYSAVVLRVLGVGASQAQLLAERMGTAPPWLAPLAYDVMEGAAIEQLSLHSGPATLIVQEKARGVLNRTTVVWSVPDRVYVLSGNMNRELAVAAADAVE